MAITCLLDENIAKVREYNLERDGRSLHCRRGRYVERLPDLIHSGITDVAVKRNEANRY